MILNNFDVDPKYFETKYGVPVLKQKENTTPPTPPADKNKVKNFFD